MNPSGTPIYDACPDENAGDARPVDACAAELRVYDEHVGDSNVCGEPPGKNVGNAHACDTRPICSIVVPAYNAARYLPDCVRSVLAQSFSDWELLIVDDGSTDGTAACIRAFAAQDARIRYVAQPRNLGVAAARNRGVAEARGEWIALLDGDDAWLPDKLSRQFALQRESGAEFLYTGARCIDGDGKALNRTFVVPERVTYDTMLRGNNIVCSSALVRRELLLRYPMARDDLHEDYIAWMRILREVGAAVGCTEPLVRYRFTAGSKSRGKLRSAWMTWRTLAYLGIPLLRRAVCFFGYAIHGLRRYAQKR